MTQNLWTSFFGEGLKYYNELKDFGEDSYGFVYKITHEPSKKFYIGKKILQNNVKHKLTKKQLAELSGPGRKPKTETLQKESNWKTYWGSNKEFVEFIKNNNKEEFKREILHICNSKLDLTYWETHYLFVNKVLFDPLSFNKNLLGKFYTGKVGK